MTTTFNILSPRNHTVAGWRHEADAYAIRHRSWRAAARHAARVHGESKALLANGSVIRFWRDGNILRQRTYRHPHFA